jgi:predicted nucleotidyltransferase
MQEEKIGHTNLKNRPYDLFFSEMESLRSLALDLEIPERTLRRAAGEGLVHGERVSPHKFRTSVRERDYLRRQWPLLSQLRTLLRTEPNVSFAALYGSQATGTAGPNSDVDLVVKLRADDIARLADLSGRLSRAVGREIQTVRLADARRVPSLLHDVVTHGRVLVDREDTWPRLVRDARRIQRDARAEASLEEAIAALDLGDEATESKR